MLLLPNFATNKNEAKKMRKILVFTMLVTSVSLLTCCSAEDPFEEFINNENNDWNNGGNMASVSLSSYTGGNGMGGRGGWR